jgi:hypothetical protein
MNSTLLTHEDDLRLQILLAEGVQAVRIDVPRQTLVALTERGEASLRLRPQGRPDSYWRQVREVLSGHALNSPGGYPVYLERWTRMGQTSARSLDALLCLGEPEAVMAVAHAPSLTPEQARRAWWACPGSETARAMLAHAAIRADAVGVTLAEHLLEFLPFESDAVLALTSARAILGAELLTSAALEGLWRASDSKPHLRVAFIEQVPQKLPELLSPQGAVITQSCRCWSARAFRRQSRCCRRSLIVIWGRGAGARSSCSPRSDMPGWWAHCCAASSPPRWSP